MAQRSNSVNLRSTREYLEFGFQIVKCPVCGSDTLESHWICETCGWEYDGTTEENEYSFCNEATIAAYRKKFL